MKFNIGEKVAISQRWRKRTLPDGWQNYLKENQDEFAGSGVHYLLYEKTAAKEIGFICGKRQQKISTTLSWEIEDGIEYGEFGTGPYFEGVRQLNSEHIEVYLVATRMNCLRRVSAEDIERLWNLNEK